MRIIAPNLLLYTILQLSISVYAGTVPPTLTEPSPSNENHHLATSESERIDDSSSQKHNSINTGECLNSSLDNKCDQKQLLVQETNEISHREEAQTVTNNQRNSEMVAQLDDTAQLCSRLNDIDKLNEGLLFGYDFDQNSSSSTPVNLVSSTLRQVIFIHRHGDRTPINFPSKDTLKEEPFWKFHGYGQLTNRGKARLHLLGKLMRARYDDFLDKSVNKNQIISRSSGSLRCIESAQTFLSSFIGLNELKSPDADKLVWDQKNNPLASLWQPASIQSVPATFDGMLAESAQCNSLLDEYTNVIDQSNEVKEIFSEYEPEGEILKSVMGFEMDHFYKWFWASSQIEVERTYFEDKMRHEIITAFDRIQEAGNLAMGAYQSTTKSKRLRSGLLINDMLGSMRKFRDLNHQVSGDSSLLKKFVHYSAHDMTLVVLLGMLDSWNKFPFRPDYASNIAMELHQDKDEWFVKIYYMPQVPVAPFELHLERCEAGHPTARCTLDKFSKLMEPYMVDNWQSWMQECRNNLSTIDPYAPGA